MARDSPITAPSDAAVPPVPLGCKGIGGAPAVAGDCLSSAVRCRLVSSPEHHGAWSGVPVNPPKPAGSMSPWPFRRTALARRSFARSVVRCTAAAAKSTANQPAWNVLRTESALPRAAVCPERPFARPLSTPPRTIEQQQQQHHHRHCHPRRGSHWRVKREGKPPFPLAALAQSQPPGRVLPTRGPMRKETGPGADDTPSSLTLTRASPARTHSSSSSKNGRLSICRSPPRPSPAAALQLTRLSAIIYARAPAVA